MRSKSIESGGSRALSDQDASRGATYFCSHTRICGVFMSVSNTKLLADYVIALEHKVRKKCKFIDATCIHALTPWRPVRSLRGRMFLYISQAQIDVMETSQNSSEQTLANTALSTMIWFRDATPRQVYKGNADSYQRSRAYSIWQRDKVSSRCGSLPWISLSLPFLQPLDAGLLLKRQISAAIIELFSSRRVLWKLTIKPRTPIPNPKGRSVLARHTCEFHEEF